MKIFITPNIEKKNAVSCVNSICKKLHVLQCEILMYSKFKNIFFFDYVHFDDDFEKLLQVCDVLIAVGGDGTMIHYAKHAAVYEKPVLGINLGRLGYMASLEASELDRLEDICSSNYVVEKRMMIEAVINTDKGSSSFFALNDAVISRGSLSRMIDLSVVYSGGSTALDYRADGIIFATPTGSTAYSLSAGGPVVDPGLQSILMTPICPHSLFSRSVLFNSDVILEVRAECSGEGEVYLTVDGNDSVHLHSGEKVVIKRFHRPALFIKLQDKSFAEVLNRKFLERR